MPASPASPTFSRRRSSSITSSDATPIRTHTRRRSSQYSIRRRSTNLYGVDGARLNRSSSSIAVDIGSPTTPTGAGLHESLADELGEGWGEDDDIDEGVEEAGNDSLIPASSPQSPTKFGEERTRDSGIDVTSSQTELPTPIHLGHARKPSKPKSADSDLRQQPPANPEPPKPEDTASDGFSPSLRASLSEIEALARQGLSKDDTIDEGEEPVTHFLQALKNLGGQQATLENKSTRLITAHTSLSMHLVHQNRLLQSLAYYVLSQLPHQPLFDEEEYDLVPSISSALDSIPKPAAEALSGLHRFFVSSNDLASSLSAISDSLHMTRQVTSTANHRLKSAKELVAELRKEHQATEQGIAWIEDGHWARRLEQRECAKVCKDVIGGFEEVCNSWRAKLLQSVGA